MGVALHVASIIGRHNLNGVGIGSRRCDGIGADLDIAEAVGTGSFNKEFTNISTGRSIPCKVGI